MVCEESLGGQDLPDTRKEVIKADHPIVTVAALLSAATVDAFPRDLASYARSCALRSRVCSE
jgi:hypothetical protein